jgi:prevent-host-death family protein
MSGISLRDLEGLTGRHSIRPASDVKSQWRTIVQEANELGEVIVTNHNRPEVVVVSVEHYAHLKAQALANDPLTRLRNEFDAELAILRTADAGSRLREIFASSPEDVANAANRRSDD